MRMKNRRKRRVQEKDRNGARLVARANNAVDDVVVIRLVLRILHSSYSYRNRS